MDTTKRRYVAASLCLLGLLVVFFVAESLHLPKLALVAAGLSLVTWIPLVLAAMVSATKAPRLVVEKYGLPRESRKSLKLKEFQSVDRFDTWLTKQRQLYGNAERG
jgi:hypothetical protein